MAEDQDRIDSQLLQSVRKQSHKKGKRKGRKTKETEVLSKDNGSISVGSPQDIADHGEAASSNEDDAEMEDTGERDGVDADGATKTEEDCKYQLWRVPVRKVWTKNITVAKKKTAMDSLSAIENYFATYRDK